VVVFEFVRAIIFQASRILKSTCKGEVTPLPTILALRDIRVYIGPSNSCDITVDIEALVDKFLGSRAIL